MSPRPVSSWLGTRTPRRVRAFTLHDEQLPRAKKIRRGDDHTIADRRSGLCDRNQTIVSHVPARVWPVLINCGCRIHHRPGCKCGRDLLLRRETLARAEFPKPCVRDDADIFWLAGPARLVPPHFRRGLSRCGNVLEPRDVGRCSDLFKDSKPSMTCANFIPNRDDRWNRAVTMNGRSVPEILRDLG